MIAMVLKLKFTKIHKNFEMEGEKDSKLVTAESKIYRMKHPRDSRRKKSDNNSGSISPAKITGINPFMESPRGRDKRVSVGNLVFTRLRPRLRLSEVAKSQRFKNQEKH